jgi:hypothetical protein
MYVKVRYSWTQLTLDIKRKSDSERNILKFKILNFKFYLFVAHWSTFE